MYHVSFSFFARIAYPTTILPAQYYYKSRYSRVLYLYSIYSGPTTPLPPAEPLVSLAKGEREGYSSTYLGGGTGPAAARAHCARVLKSTRSNSLSACLIFALSVRVQWRTFDEKVRLFFPAVVGDDLGCY